MVISFLSHDLIRPISIQLYVRIIPMQFSYSLNFQPIICWVVPMQCPYLFNFQPIICSQALLLFVQSITNPMFGFLCNDIISPISSQSYVWIDPIQCSHSLNFYPIIWQDCSYAMFLFIKFLANHMFGLFLCNAFICPISSQSYFQIVPMQCSYLFNFQPIICSDCSYDLLLFVKFLSNHIFILLLCVSLIH